MGTLLPLDATALAKRLGCSLATAYRRIERLLARQSDPKTLRVEKRPVSIGSGATREEYVVLWPVGANDNPTAND